MSRESYHHGDLRAVILAQAATLVAEQPQVRSWAAALARSTTRMRRPIPRPPRSRRGHWSTGFAAVAQRSDQGRARWSDRDRRASRVDALRGL